MKSTIQIIVLIGLCASCKQKDFKYDFGFETKAIVNEKIKIPKYNKVNLLYKDTVLLYSSTDYYTSPCFMDSGRLKIMSSLNPLYNFRITLNRDLTFKSTYNDIFKQNGSPLFHREILKSKITKQRLLVNKNKYSIGDTVIGTYYFQLHLAFSNDSSSIINDSFSFAYIVQEKGIRLENIFNINHFCVFGNSYPNKNPIVLSSNGLIQLDSNLKNLPLNDSFERRTKPKVEQVISCKKMNDSIQIYLTNKTNENSILSIVVGSKNNYRFYYENPLPLMCPNSYDYFISCSNLFFNKKQYNKGDTLYCRGYYLLSVLYSTSGQYYNMLDSISFGTVIK